jgi:hypothetical protein
MNLKRIFRPNWMGEQQHERATNGRAGALERVIVLNPPSPLEGTSMSLWHSILPNFYATLEDGQMIGTADLANRVWVANLCQHKNSKQIAGMPLRWHGSAGTLEPRWVSNPAPTQFPNGIGDVIYAVTDQIYGWGYALLYVTSEYDSGYARTFDVIPSSACTPYFDGDGRKVYKVGDTVLPNRRVVQIDRNPTTAAHGTSALSAFAQRAYSLLAAGNQSLNVSQDNMPQGYLKSEQRLTRDQALDVQNQWTNPDVPGSVRALGQGFDFVKTGINPADMALLDTQKWDASVVAAAYGVPPILVNIAVEGALVYQNPLLLMQAWWFTELETTAKQIVDAFTARLLPAGQWVHVDASRFTPGHTEGGVQDPQASPHEDTPPNVAKASPAQGLTAIGGGRT